MHERVGSKAPELLAIEPEDDATAREDEEHGHDKQDGSFKPVRYSPGGNELAICAVVSVVSMENPGSGHT